MLGRDGLIGVYMMANRMHGAIYIGVTSDLIARADQHRRGVVEGYTRRYGLKRLVWYELHETLVDAIQREKSLKRYARDWKANLIEGMNPDWSDLFPALVSGGVEAAPDPDTYRDWAPGERATPTLRPLPKGWRTDES